MKVQVHSGPLTEEVVGAHNAVLLTQTALPDLLRFNAFCRTNNIKFLAAECWGLAGFAFADFGDEFMVRDKDGEETRQTVVVNITNDAEGVVTVHEDKRHGFEDGDYVKFSEVEGMVEVNGEEPRPIKFMGPFQFSIEDTTGYSTYVQGGIVESVKVPTKVEFKSLEEKIKEPVDPDMGMLMPPDLAKFGRSE